MSSTTERILDSLERPTYVTTTPVATLRDQFAMAALPVATAWASTPPEVAGLAYELADAMLAARDVKREGTV